MAIVGKSLKGIESTHRFFQPNTAYLVTTQFLLHGKAQNLILN